MPSIKNNSPGGGKLLNLKNSKVIPLKKYGKTRNVGLRDGYQTTSGDTTPINGIPSNGITGMYMQIKSKDSSNYYDTAALKSSSPNFKMDDNNFGDIVNKVEQVPPRDKESNLGNTARTHNFDKAAGSVDDGANVLIYYK